jgi:hypothetical protein
MNHQHPRRLKPAQSLQQRLAERVRRHVEAKLALGVPRGDHFPQETQPPNVTAHMDQFRRSHGLKLRE